MIESEDFSGAAPDASLCIVKLKPCKQYLRQFYGTAADVPAYQENDIMAGISYCIQKAQEAGVTVVVASGRDYDGVPHDQLKEVAMPYLITTNGAAVYRTADRICLDEHCLPAEKLLSIFEFILQREVYMTVFIDGHNYTPVSVYDYVWRLGLPEHIVKSFPGRTS